ncbi:DUF4326 domain-containing protein [Arthrobacter agilis]|uniref:DUF4326 domain-containing protein n=1 Tax=Arthrobacter agilis TaxID=37921 RepID=UPI003B6717FE
MPEEAVYVGRGSVWENPWVVDSERATDPPRNQYRRTAAETVDLYGSWISYIADDVRRELAGKDLACWCPLDQPRHADVLLKIANPDDTLTTALADPEGQALVQAIHDRKLNH